MADRLRLKFSHRFPGIIWNTLLLPEKSMLFLEVRNHPLKTVSFTAFQYIDDKFSWRDIQLEEKWWVALGAVTLDKVLFTIYLDTKNPDKKATLAYHQNPMALAWWNNDFSISLVSGDVVTGYSSRFMGKEIYLDVNTGEETKPSGMIEGEGAPDPTLRPVQYLDNSPHFDTVKTFLIQKLNLLPVLAFEYLEHDGRIFVSYYLMETGLTNHLIVIGSDGEVLLHEKLGEQLKGIGMDTFFVLSGCVFFVKNREELVSYFL